MGLIVLVIILAIVLFVLLSSIKVVNTGYLYVVERLGQFSRILRTRLAFYHSRY